MINSLLVHQLITSFPLRTFEGIHVITNQLISGLTFTYYNSTFELKKKSKKWVTYFHQAVVVVVTNMRGWMKQTLKMMKGQV